VGLVRARPCLPACPQNSFPEPNHSAAQDSLCKVQKRSLAGSAEENL
jgi:hypothetical protein